MLRLEEVIQLKENEDVRAITRRHGLTLVPGLSLATFLIVAPFFFMFPLFGTGPAGVILFAVLVIVGLFIAFRTFVIWDGDVLLVTNRRIVDVDQKGIFARTVSEITLENIHDISWTTRGLIDKILRIGSLRVQTDSGNLTIEAPHIPRPHDLSNLVNDLRHLTKPKHQMERIERSNEPEVRPEHAELLKKVVSQLESLDDDALNKVGRSLKQDDRDITIKKLFGEGSDDQLKPMDDV